MYSHRVYKIEKNRDDQVNRDRLTGLILELATEKQEYYVKRLELKNRVSNYLGGSIYENEIWNLLDSDNFDTTPANFINQLESKFNKVNTAKYDKLIVAQKDAIQEFLQTHESHVKKTVLFCEKIYLHYSFKDIDDPVKRLLTSMSNINNNDIEYDSPEQIFYYYFISGKIISATEHLMDKLHALIPKEK